jgi:hypothetical protein
MLNGSNAVVGKHEVDGADLQHFVAPVGVGVTAGMPVAVGLVVGVTLEDADDNGLATIDSDRKRWKFDVDNVLTYNASTGLAATFKAVEYGDIVYKDPLENDNEELTLSPKNASGTDNVPFGTVVYGDNWTTGPGGESAGYSGVSTVYTEPDVVILVSDYRA